MSTISRLRYVIAANVNALLEKAEDPEKLLRALIREMEDAGEEARMACAELLAEQKRMQRLEEQLSKEQSQWRKRAEMAVEQGRDDLARDALKARSGIAAQREAVRDETKHLAERMDQMEQDMATLKTRLAEAKTRLKTLLAAAPARPAAPISPTPGERRVSRAMQRFDHLQAQVDNLEARVRSYDVGGPAPSVWREAASAPTDPAIEAELRDLKQRLAGGRAPDSAQGEVSA